jgi:hypothetical protein
MNEFNQCFRLIDVEWFTYLAQPDRFCCLQYVKIINEVYLNLE